jgi:glycosyltransferase involved in cell wall biosynthesis
MPQANWIGTVPHGLPLELYAFSPQGSGYLAFLGRISSEKRVDRAIEIATRLGKPLKIAAKIDKADTEYFEAEIRPLLSNPLVEFVGEIGDEDKPAFLGGADALLFPIDWPEPFGLVVIEAMACGAPVVAFRNGSVPELVEHGLTGFIVDSVDAALEATAAIGTIDRHACRARFLQRFTAERMALDYVALYERAMVDAKAAA